MKNTKSKGCILEEKKPKKSLKKIAIQSDEDESISDEEIIPQVVIPDHVISFLRQKFVFQPDDSFKEVAPTRKEEKPIEAPPVKSHKGRKKRVFEEIETSETYNLLGNYDNDSLPDVRLPYNYSVPDHLLDEFTKLYPNPPEKKRKGKFNLFPAQRILGKEKIYIGSNWILRFWTPRRIDIMVQVLTKQCKCNLSLLEWCCTNWSKEYGVFYDIKENGNTKYFFIHQEYNKFMHEFHKLCADSYGRNQRILIEYVCNSDIIQCTNKSERIQWNTNVVGVRYINGKKMVYVVTTVGQLIFFHWAIKNNVVYYCDENADKIKVHMKTRKDLNKEIGGKRKKLIQEPLKKSLLVETPVKFDFDKMQSFENIETSLIEGLEKFFIE